MRQTLAWPFTFLSGNTSVSSLVPSSDGGGVEGGAFELLSSWMIELVVMTEVVSTH